MHVLITGANGFIGRKLTDALAKTGKIAGQSISRLTLADMVFPPRMTLDYPVQRLCVNIANMDQVSDMFDPAPDIIFHMAAAVSSAAEADFDLGMNANLQGTMNIFAAARSAGNTPKIIMASSVAVHGGDAPMVVTGTTAPNPQTSYGTQKAMAELLLNDYVRKGFVTGCALRLPTVTIRPGKPNAAASSFMSSIFRDTLQGDTANCPVDRDFLIWHTAPRTVVTNLLHAATITPEKWGGKLLH